MKPLRSICALLLCLLVLVSSSSFMVGIHFCKGELKHFALLTTAEGCEKEKKLPPCHKHLSSPCCEDESIVHEGKGFKASIHEFSYSAGPVFDVDLPEVVLAEIIPSAIPAHASYFDYDPPLRSPDLTITYRVFII
jgi:hypothetical protein